MTVSQISGLVLFVTGWAVMVSAVCFYGAGNLHFHNLIDACFLVSFLASAATMTVCSVVAFFSRIAPKTINSEKVNLYPLSSTVVFFREEFFRRIQS